MNLKLTLTLLVASGCMSVFGAEVETEVKLYPNVQRYLGDVSKLERDKYINFHNSSFNDPDVTKFRNDYGVGFGRAFSGAQSYAYSRTKKAGVYPAAKANPTGEVRKVSRFIATQHTSPSNVPWGLDKEKAADWAVEYYSNVARVVPEFYEPLNEPMVKAWTAQFKPNDGIHQMREHFADYYAAIGRKIKAAPALKNMKMIGYGGAYPSMEVDDFDVWNTRMKMFIDRAGQYMDGFSIHLYDGINIVGTSTRRSGSNGEAILDLIEAYSFIKLGEVKPHATSEYGAIYKDDGIYKPEISPKTVCSVNHIMFNLMERQDKMLISVPFISEKATWRYGPGKENTPYTAVLWLPENPNDIKNTKWVYNERIAFFEQWKGVNGERVDITSSNPDIQVLAFKGDKLYVALDNVDENVHNISLRSMSSLSGAKSVSLRRLKMEEKGISYVDQPVNKMPEKLTIAPNETVIIVVEMGKSKGKYENAIRRTKYYSQSYLQPIKANEAITFDYEGVKSGTGRGIVRMSVGVPLEKDKGFVIEDGTKMTINGVNVDIPKNWAGYDQAGREDFFGTIKIPFDLSLLKDGKNTVSVTFPKTGGRVASMIIQSERYDKNVK